MGFQRLQANEQEIESLIKARSNENDEQIIAFKTPPITCDLQTKESDPSNTEPITSDDNYASWVMKYPSALSMFDEMLNAAKGKTIVVFLDYDGTLSPIVDDPNQATISEEMRSAVRDVAEHFPTAIISGRCRDKVYEFVQLTDIYYAGSHGMDIMAPVRTIRPANADYQTRTVDTMGNEVVVFQPAQEFLPAIQEILKAVEEKTKTIRGVTIENNKFCVSVHFRNIDKEDYFELEEQVKSVLEDYPKFHLTRGRKVIQSRGQGYPIIVSSIPKETNASYSLCDPSEVLSFLNRLTEWWNSSLG
ncbi:trehalose-phosphate phosphatase B-like isoform X2 [Macadamia integrifolia]|uniref:trehalose-phosphate phosphatase B-like isoform X2 n=1 Tax=Macadamia integrifolia TaxID=60698 RepID=UPI001C4F2CDC|nr:trehalose-phosphate phosphatase B-like isoform X2 [Macadamia integrifolia]